ncbi:AVN_HP_G0106880.mRNA.1.CDS.1 [Saccharomyces cerevisiae]|nr:AVN_HP_G0106880.mRNA.1.CDS.1 [Saccharomyces cerevisiae]CAI6984388.1 AVN_HP_G0106880.mRNA.1.CDS.1 [Saccharomyces cerevisiae]
MANTVGGILSGVNPFHYNSSSPLTLFLFQACLILLVCNLIHIPFSMMRQPKVISEVISGVILGPTVFGQIPNYTYTIFPTSSIPGLNLVANLGIILFMFFLGLEVDIAFIKKHLKKALVIGIATLAVPFGFGCLLAIPLFHTYANKTEGERHIKFSVFMVFIAVSISVTAFPVLCRILNELRLIKDRAGIVVLAAGIINDIMGWILLALSIILSSAEGSPVNTVYILLITFAWFLIYFFPLKYLLRWVLIRTHELDRSKPSPLATMCILFIMFISAYFTDIIGVHPIFGAFIAGLVVPRDDHYVVKLTERMEDIPNIVFIPIYFAVAGLNVDLTLLNEGRDWGYVFATIGIAIFTKIISGTLTAKLTGLFWREATAAGVLMSCKGIVEIVVLTVGLNAGIISRKIFGMFVLMALVSTFVTTPLTQLVYPDSYRDGVRKSLSTPAEDDGAADGLDSEGVDKTEINTQLNSLADFSKYRIGELTTVINTTEAISPSLKLLNYLSLGVSPKPKNNKHKNETSLSRMTTATDSTLKSNTFKIKKMVHIWSKSVDDVDTNLSVIDEKLTPFEGVGALRAIHLRLLTERTTDLLQSSSLYNDDPHFTANTDSLLQIFDIFSNLSKIPFSSEVVFSTMREKAANIATMKMDSTDLILLPLKGASYEYRGSPVFIDEKYANYDHIYSHLLGLNELSSTFFKSIFQSLKANFAVQISNTYGRLNADRFKRKRFNLLLPKPYLTQSDYLGLYLLLLICYRDGYNNDNASCSIFINSKNIDFAKDLSTAFAEHDWLNESTIKIVDIPFETKVPEEAIEKPSFIETVLDVGLSDTALADIEETTFIIGEDLPDESEPFSEEVRTVIFEGSNRRFDTLIVHHFSSE